MLFNLVAFMVMMQMPKTEIKKKVTPPLKLKIDILMWDDICDICTPIEYEIRGIFVGLVMLIQIPRIRSNVAKCHILRCFVCIGGAEWKGRHSNLILKN